MTNMKKLYMIFLLFITASFVGCYEDKGNYNYKDIQRLTIAFENSTINTAIDDTVRITPLLNLNIDETSPNHTFKWSIDGETRPEWNKKDFSWIVDKSFKNVHITLEITDKRNEMVYAGRIPLDVVGIYEFSDSWMILSDVGGESLLSFLSVMEMKINSETEQYDITKSRFIRDVYAEANNGGKLGNGPICLQEHFREAVDHNEDVIGNVCVFQQSGAVDLTGVTFEKEIDMNEAFLGNIYPVGATLRPGSFMTMVDVLSDQEGKLYSRIKASEKAYHSEYFLQDPLSATGEKEPLQDCKVVRGYYAPNRIPYTLIYDGGKKRMLTMFSPANDVDDLPNAGKIEPVWPYDSGLDISGIVPLNNMTGYDVLHLKMFQVGDYHEYGYHIIMKEIATNKLYLQSFTTSHPWSKPARVITAVSRVEIKGLPEIPSIMAFPIYSDQEYAFFAMGNVLYMVNTKNMDKPAEVYYTFNSAITALNFDNYGNKFLAVGLDDGSFFVLGTIGAKELSDDKKILYTCPQKLGKIVDIQHKENTPWNY